MTNATVVIPTIKETVRTLESIPDHIPVSIERDGTLNVARNRGVRTTETEIVIIMDDDISFPPETIKDLVERVDKDTLLGMEGWDFDLIAGRVMVFHRDLWSDIGGFDEHLGSHMADTDFALKAKNNGYNLDQLPRNMFDHEEHERSITRWDRTWRTGYLLAKHPRSAPRLLRGVL